MVRGAEREIVVLHRLRQRLIEIVIARVRLDFRVVRRGARIEEIVHERRYLQVVDGNAAAQRRELRR